MKVGTTKDQGLYNNPSAAVHPGALTAGTIPQYNTIEANGEKLFIYSDISSELYSCINTKSIHFINYIVIMIF